MKYWQSLLENGYSSIEDLHNARPFPSENLDLLNQIQNRFPVHVNPYYYSLIKHSDPDDPIYKMCIPSVFEANRTGSFDTSGERSNTVMKGVQHKYPDTLLILSTNRCAMYCRHCFRKRLVGLSEPETDFCSGIEEIIAYINKHKEINNVLISGGDAFLNTNAVISQYLKHLTRIPHLDFIRFGTRTPVVLPQRITSDSELVSILEKYSGIKHIYIVTQFNHPNEITYESIAAIKTLQRKDIFIRNQTVLLKGVNDSGTVLGELLRKLTAIGVDPYYIFQCRPVTGVKDHFQVPLKRGAAIVQEAVRNQNGFGKSCRYMLSHEKGKIEIVGQVSEDLMCFKFHRAKNRENVGRVFVKSVTDSQCWL